MVDEGVGKTRGVVTVGAIPDGVLVNGRLRHSSNAKGNVCRPAIVAGCTISRDTQVVEYRRGEHVARMADTAILIRGQMVCPLDQIGVGWKELRCMATLAALSDVRMNRRQEVRECEAVGKLVAEAAIILGRDVVVRLRRGDAGVVAGGAISRIYPSMAIGDSRKGGEVAGVVTVRAVQVCGYVITRFAEADSAVMAGRTVARIYPEMIENCIPEVHRVVANDTILGGWQMIAELADGDHVVVAHLAAVDHTEVIIGAGGESARRVADAAVFAGRHVVGQFPASADPMTGGTVIDNTGMVEHPLGEAVGVVTGTAVVIGGGVGGGGRLSGRSNAVVVVVA